MSGEMTLFGGKGNALASSDLFQSLLDMNKTLAGGPGGGPRISIKGGRFREIVGGEQVRVFKGDQLNVVVVNAAPISRSYFEGDYDPNNPAAPTCWSIDTKVPHPDVPEEQRQASSCATCPMNVKGSGTNNGRACRFNQRLAVTVEGDEESTVYQMQIPATSIFGEANKGQMGMQAYAKLLAAHKTPIIAVVTGISFDEDSETPKLVFKPVRPLDEEELEAAVAAKDSQAALDAITFTVSQTDGTAEPSKPKSKAKDEDEPAPKRTRSKPAVEDEDEPAPKRKPKAKVEDEDDEPAPKRKAKPKVEDEDDEEPVKRTKAAEAPKAKADLASVISQWDDDDE